MRLRRTSVCDVGYTHAQLAMCEGAEVPDLIGADCRLLFVGINPGLWTAATGIHFAHPSNRFYPSLLEAGIIDEPVVVDPECPSIAMPGVAPSPSVLGSGRMQMIERGIGITNIVRRATARASELRAEELREGAETLRETVARHAPAVAAIAGITAFRTAFGRPRAALGPQDMDIDGTAVWVVPNPSGLNAHETVASLARKHREVAERAGVDLR